ncbi:MAG: phosphoribosylglycinamide formyltransferase [Desulfovibrionaceae bacterium]|nr:phosphoribosylglycinamide formyltransferase [Desulfovibrionaceae bacterium]
MTIQIAVLASGIGTNLAAIIKSIASGRLEARVKLVLSNKSDAPVLDIARENGIPVWARDHREYESREAFDTAMLEAIRAEGVDTIALAGYMRMLSPSFIKAYAGRILNIHPAILPSFPGVSGYADAVEYGVRITGCTVHFVDEQMDQGPVIIQAAVPVGPNDTPENTIARIHALEYRIYPQALQWLARNRLSVEGRRVRLRAAKFPSVEIASCQTGALGPWMVCPPLEEGF